MTKLEKVVKALLRPTQELKSWWRDGRTLEQKKCYLEINYPTLYRALYEEEENG